MKKSEHSEAVQWEIEVIQQLEELLDCDTSDAQGFLMAHEFFSGQAWAMGLDPIQAAKYIKARSENKTPHSKN